MTVDGEWSGGDWPDGKPAGLEPAREGQDGEGPDGWSAAERGEWLASHRWEMDRGESSWLAALGRFDREQGWAADGQLSVVAWLMWRTDMARATAFEKVRIARELAVRPVVAQAFAEGRISYSAVRVITRIDGPDPDVDAALVDLAEAGSVADVERAARVYQRYADQERPPPDPSEARGVRVVRNGDGTASVTVTLTELEAEELAAALQAFLDLGAEPGESPRGDTDAGSNADAGPTAADAPAGEDDERAGEDEADEADTTWAESPHGDGGGAPAADPWQASGAVRWGQRRADALMEIVRTALAHAGDGHALGADRYLVHLVVAGGATELLDGTPVDAATASEVACDASQVVHAGDPLRLGRRTRVWSTAQRRAILVRDRGCCRFPGCEHRIGDIHHLRAWEDGGPTDVSNGMLVCAGHHRLLHHGFTASGDTDGPVTFRRPDGTVLGRSEPGRGGCGRRPDRLTR